MEKSPKEIAIEKGKKELEKGILNAVKAASLMGEGEIIYYLHVIRVLRLTEFLKNYDESRENVLKTLMHRANDAYRYILQLLIKYASKRFVLVDKVGFYNNRLVEELTRFVMELNHKYEANNFLTMTPKLDVYGERNQNVKFDMQDIMKDPILSKFMYYGARVELDNEFENNSLLKKEDYFNKFKKEYKPYDDLFLKEFEIDIETFLELIDFMLINFENTIKNNLDKYIYLDDETIDVKAEVTMIEMSPAFFQEKNIFIDKYGIKIIKVLEKLTFNPSQFSENELRYDQINRQPLINYGNQLIISPDLLLDSLFVNTHYSILENTNSNNEYKKRYSENFIDQIVELAVNFEFQEVNRNLELYDGKKQLGDIDLILKSEKGEYLYVEAKDHSIPMDVRIHSQEDVESRLEYLKKNWEQKVLRRIEHLKINYSKYGLPSQFTYIIVSRSPEILSHFSNINVFTLRELEVYFMGGNLADTFESIENKLYKDYGSDLTAEELKEIQVALGGKVRFEKE